MPIQYEVKAGDTVDAIASRYGVPRSAVSGYRSKDPNTILPGEILDIAQTTGQQLPQAGAVVDGNALQSSNTPPQAPQSPVGIVSVSQRPVAPKTVSVSQTAPQSATDIPAQPAQTFTTPSGVVVDALGNTVQDSPTSQLGQYGLSDTAVAQGFETNPFGTITGLTQQIMQSIGLPDIRSNVTELSNEIEKLANERDDEVQRIEDNPWTSAGSKQQLIQKVVDRYEKKIANRNNTLTLLQNNYQDARQQAQFAVQTAIGLYDKQRTFDYNKTQDFLDRQEKVLEAQSAAGPMTVENVGGFQVLRDSSGKIVSTKVPSATRGATATPGTPGTPIVDSIGQTLQYGTPEYVTERLLQTVSSKTKPVASEREQLSQFGRVIAQTSGLVSSLSKTQTDPIVGYFKSLNPYDFDARSVNAQLNALVPGVARGVYGEVGVLTDTDIERYIKTLPNITSTEEQNKFVALLTLTNAKRAYEETLINLANSNVNVSGFVDSYQNIVNRVEDLENELGSNDTQEARDIASEIVGVSFRAPTSFTSFFSSIFGG